MPRRRLQQTFKLAAQVGFFDEYPVLPDGVDPQLTLSRADRAQPFFLVCEKDSLIVQMTGHAHVEFKNSSVLSMATCPGDFVYVPARTPHRIVPAEDSLLYRYKAERAGLEAVAWYCQNCGEQVHRVTWDAADELPQEGYVRAVSEFNASESLRTCGKCANVHPPVDAAGNNWHRIATELRTPVDPDNDDW
jgi:3-hydroxyanthranilate 3,4-dioxygenase